MDEKTKKYDNLEAFFAAGQIMQKFQSIHNIIRNDYLELLKLTEANFKNETSFNSLYRACIRSLFALMEADIFSLNILDSYNGFDDRDSFIPKLKSTYKQIARTWGKEDIQKKYFDSKLTNLLEIKVLRDQLIHPKDVSHIHVASEDAYNAVKNVFNDYDEFVNELMRNFFISTNIPVRL